MGKLGFIGGSGLYSVKNIEIIDEVQVDTPFGAPSDKFIKGIYNDQEVYFLPRHGKGHRFLPSEVNYRANIFGFKKLGVDCLVSVSAVGSLSEELAPKDFFCPDQFIDWTRGLRERTFFGNGVIGHVSAANPIDTNLLNLIKNSSKEIGQEIKYGGSYICIEGPQFSSKAESNIYRSFGAKVIGMTNVPEAYLAKEAAMAYATIAMITDYDCWKEEHCSVDEIMEVMKYNNQRAQELIPKIISNYKNNPIKPIKENEVGLMTPKENLTNEQLKIIEVLMS